MSKLNERTTLALGDKIMQCLAGSTFCMLGCGAVGALFAEMLVRTGAKNIILIDGDEVEESNLNRCFSFLLEDCGEKKTLVLKKRLEAINKNIKVQTYEEHFRKRYGDEKTLPQERLVQQAEYVIIGIDNNADRITAQEFCDGQKNILTLSVGIEITENGEASYDVVWKPKTREEDRDREGYGKGSYVSVVTEATAAGFNMLLAHIYCAKADYTKLCREFKEFIPSELNRK